MKKIAKIVLQRIPDYDAPLDYLGEFSNEPGEYAIKHEGGSHTLPYFNAANVENMKQARQNYARMMEFERGEVMCYGVKATAQIQTSPQGQNWLINTISSGGLWGIESDAGEEYFQDEEANQRAELAEVLAELGFSDAEIKAAPLTKDVA